MWVIRIHGILYLCFKMTSFFLPTYYDLDTIPLVKKSQSGEILNMRPGLN